MSSHRTVLHLPVTFVLPDGCDPAAFAKFLADEAAMGIEKIGLADGDVEAAETSHDPVLDAYPAPAVRSEADVAGWADAPAFLISGGRRGCGHYAINATDPAYGARPVTRAYGHAVSDDYTNFADAEDMREMLNRAWSLDGGRGADIQTATRGPRPACNVCADPGRPVDDGTGHPYALCDSDDEGHACVREGIAKNLARAALYGDSDGEQD